MDMAAGYAAQTLEGIRKNATSVALGATLGRNILDDLATPVEVGSLNATAGHTGHSGMMPETDQVDRTQFLGRRSGALGVVGACKYCCGRVLRYLS